MTRKVRFVCIMLVCIAMIFFDFYKIKVLAISAENGIEVHADKENIQELVNDSIKNSENECSNSKSLDSEATDEKIENEGIGSDYEGADKRNREKSEQVSQEELSDTSGKEFDNSENDGSIESSDSSTEIENSDEKLNEDEELKSDIDILQDEDIAENTDNEATTPVVDAKQIVNEFTVTISDQMVVDIMGTGECIVGENLVFCAKLNTVYLESLGHEVKSVIVSCGYYSEVMKKNTYEEYVATINISQDSFDTHVPMITITLDDDNEVSLSAMKTLRLDKKAPLINVSLVDGNSIINKEWVSKNDGYENLQLKIDVEDESRISECIVTSASATKKHSVIQVDNSYYVDVSLIEQITEYTISVKDIGGNKSEVSYMVKVDNTAPSKEVRVSFSGSQIIDCDKEIKDGYSLGKGYGEVYSSDHIIMHLAVADNTSLSAISSGISKVIVSVLMITVDGEREQEYTLSCNGEKFETVTFCASNGQLEPEIKYQIKKVIIQDNAGNCTELANEDKCIDSVVYTVDGRMPIVTYHYTNGILDFQEENTVFYGEIASGIVEISDLNLDQYQINLSNVDDYDTADIHKEYQDNVKAVYSFTLDKDGKYQISTKINEILEAGVEEYRVEEKSSIMIVDTVAPILEVELFGENGGKLANYADQYYNETINLKTLVIEQYLDLIEVNIFGNDSLQMSYTQDDFSQSLEGTQYALTCSIIEDGEYYVEVRCKDKAGREASFQSDRFNIDRTIPKVTITYDNNNAKNEVYYNAERTATIKVEDTALNMDTVELKIDSAQGNVPALSPWSETGIGTDKIFIAKVSFTDDDIYDVTFSCEDLAGNRSEICDGGHFVIDRTAPVVKIEFDNNINTNEIYYNKDRKARITVEDISFNQDAFVILNENEEDIVWVDTPGIWSGTDIYHTTEIMCDKEGTYHFTIYAEDLAGNEAVSVDSETFIIDKTAPQIDIIGVTDESANRGEIIPIVSYQDKNLDDNVSNVVLSGYKNGAVSMHSVVYSDKNKRSVKYGAFPQTREMDDVYTLTVHIEDKAGNQSEEEYVFSVNRFGSTFGIDKATSELMTKYYMREEQDIVVTEVNVDHLKQAEITVSHNGEPRTLKKDIDYKVTAEGSNATWKSYTYTIYKKNFEKEGQFIVSVFSMDTADNQSDNNAQGVEIAFAIDKSAPSIVVTGLENEGIYTQNELTFRMDIQDNMSLESADIIVNNKTLKSYGQEELTEAVSYSLSESTELMDITIRAKDVVGNTSEKNFYNVQLGQVSNSGEKGETNVNNLHIGLSNETLIQMNILRIGSIMIAMSAVFITIFVTFLKKKKE